MQKSIWNNVKYLGEQHDLRRDLSGSRAEDNDEVMSFQPRLVRE